MPRIRTACLLAAALALLPGLAAAAPAADPRWQRLEHFLRTQTANAPQRYSGAVVLVEHKGKPVFAGHYGHQDMARSVPMGGDSIFRIYSMTKPVASVALLLLLEEGRVQLDDPVARHLPAFAGLQQFSDGGHTQAAATLTLRHLLTHTSGWSSSRDTHPQAAAALVAADIDNATDLQDLARRLSRAPLAEAPGTHFHYEGANTDLIAAVVEAVSGQHFAAFLQQRIFTPLGMVDTGFEVPAAKRHRVVDLPTTDADGRLVRADSPSARLPGVRLKAYDNAAGGLYSTAADYLAFARMLLGRAPHGQAPLLSRKTRELMMADQLGGAFAAPVAGFSRGEGFGLGGYVVTDPAVRGRLGSVGQFGWSGAAATYFTVDPAEDLIAIALLQYVDEGRGPRLPSVATPFYNLVYQAID